MVFDSMPLGLTMVRRLFNLSLFVSLLWPQFSYAQTRSPDETIKIQTTIVVIPTSVKTRNGVGIAGLTKEDFRVYENKVEQDIAHFESPGDPITVAIVIDRSDSTNLKLSEMRKAASSFIDKLESRDQALIVAFDKNIHCVLGATSDRDLLKLGLFAIGAGGGTALYDSVDHVVRSPFQNIGGRKAVILLTDGIDTSSTKATFETSALAVAENNIAVFPIQYEPENLTTKTVSPGAYREGASIYTTPSGESISSAYQRGTRYLRLLSDSSGGRFQLADSTKKLQTAFEQIAAELRQRYYLGFYPENPVSKREKRKLKVTVRVSGAKVENRESYVASP